MSLTQAFTVGVFNEHYVGQYSEREMELRRICARDEASNLRKILGDRLPEVNTVLDVGCGTGAVLSEVAKLNIGTTFAGIDVEDPCQHADRNSDRLSLKIYDGRAIPFMDPGFDLVFSSHVLEHVNHERILLEEMRRVAAKYIYIEVPCELHLRTTHGTLQNTLNIGHINAYTPHSFSLKLQTSGLRIIDIRWFDNNIQVYKFKSRPARAYISSILRKTALHLSANWASHIFTYPCGALCEAI